MVKGPRQNFPYTSLHERVKVGIISVKEFVSLSVEYFVDYHISFEYLETVF